MVHRKAGKREAVNHIYNIYGDKGMRKRVPISLLGVIALALVLLIGAVVWLVNRGVTGVVDNAIGVADEITGVEDGNIGADEGTTGADEGSAEQSSDKTGVEALPDPVNWQNVVENWANGLLGNKSVIIYDIDRDELAASYNTSEEYIMESLYKLFVVYEGYKRIENGAWDANMVVNSAGQTLLTCLDRAIRDSDSACAEPIWELIGQDELDKIAHEEWGISANTHIKTLLSNVEDILKIMRRFYEHPDFSDAELVAKMQDSFLNQPPSAGLCGGPCNWRQGLPSGFSTAVDVYNKVGWRHNGKDWDTYHDAAILHFKDADRWFIIAVMTNHVAFQSIRNLATQLEAAF